MWIWEKCINPNLNEYEIYSAIPRILYTPADGQGIGICEELI